jgi:hypothetical protein
MHARASLSLGFAFDHTSAITGPGKCSYASLSRAIAFAVLLHPLSPAHLLIHRLLRAALPRDRDSPLLYKYKLSSSTPSLLAFSSCRCFSGNYKRGPFNFFRGTGFQAPPRRFYQIDTRLVLGYANRFTFAVIFTIGRVVSY